MGLSNMAAPSEGVLTVILIHAALSVSILRSILRSALRGLRSHPLPPPEPTLTDRFMNRFEPVRFGPGGSDAPDCRVCLCRFEPESAVSRLPCGHLFHRSCLETWIGYRHATCPLCRTRLLPGEPDPVWSSASRVLLV